MLLVLYSSLLSYMLFFTICVAPVSNKILDENNKSKFLRNIFPRNFIFGLIIASLAFIFSFILKNHWSIVISFIISLGFIINLLIIMPKINFISDSDSLEKEKKKKQFRNWHFSSVFIYLIQIIISIVGIYLNI
jgi:magnesium-transporting ATPase (P-type)